MDTIGQSLWFLMFVTPLFIIPLVWRLTQLRKTVRLLLGLLIAVGISLLFYCVSLLIIFRDGMGPGS